MTLNIGQRVEHVDTTYACYGTVVDVKNDGYVMVVWDSPDAEPGMDPEPSPEIPNALVALEA